MKVIKLYMHRESEPRFFEFIKIGDANLADAGLYKWVLVAYPLDKPEPKRSAKWLDPSRIRIDWIKEFV